MPKLTAFSAFIFDMDGLVLDTESTYFAAWQLAVEAMGYRGDPHAFKALSGYHYSQVEAQLLSWYGADFNLQSFRRLGGEFWQRYVNEHGIVVKQGVIALLDYADQNQIPVCLATNSAAINARECLVIAGIKHRFPLIVTGDDVERVKPEPDIFLKAADRMQADIRRCLVFEDSHTGIVAASASGAHTVYVPSSLPVNPLTVALCDCMIDDLSQVFQSLPAQTAIGI
jgi:beta-phosphoglucomutase